MQNTNELPLTLMAVHAHPDDECLGGGGVLAKYSAEGARTVLVTATGGEEGEIHDPDLTEEEARPRLKEIRAAELRRAVAVLGISDLEFLGYRDSGMVDTPANAHPANFHNADLDEATGRLVRLIRKYRPQVLITYNEDGGYGHPDHLQTHRVTAAAFDAAADPARYPEAGPAWAPAKLYAIAWSRERWRTVWAEMKARGLNPNPQEDQNEEQEQAQDDDEEEWGQAEETITAFIDTAAYWRTTREALRQHRTQPVQFFLNMPDDLAALARETEYFVLLRSRVETTRPEDDLFAGVRAGAAVAAR
ncbi:MAG: PIG-L family deacetylase [Thermomicrobiales bacterium]